MRVLRLGIGIWAFISAIQTREPLVGFMGLVLMGMAIMNVGCGGASGCATYVPKEPKAKPETEEVQYEEVS